MLWSTDPVLAPCLFCLLAQWRPPRHPVKPPLVPSPSPGYRSLPLGYRKEPSRSPPPSFLQFFLYSQPGVIVTCQVHCIPLHFSHSKLPLPLLWFLVLFAHLSVPLNMATASAWQAGLPLGRSLPTPDEPMHPRKVRLPQVPSALTSLRKRASCFETFNSFSFSFYRKVHESNDHIGLPRHPQNPECHSGCGGLSDFMNGFSLFSILLLIS